MKKLCDTVDRFCLTHPRFGIPNLMRYVAGITAVVLLLDMFSQGMASSILGFSMPLIKSGELWRLATWLFIPEGSHVWALIMVFFYYSIGSDVENYWGTAKFTLFYLISAALMLGFSLVSLLWTPSPILSNTILNNVLFLAFATLYPTAMIRVQLILPIQAKWLAILYVILTLSDALRFGFYSLLWELPMLLAVWLTYAVFFWDRIADLLAEFGFRVRRVNDPKTIRFKSAVKQQRKKEAERGYRHKCEVCGRTDTDFPDLQFRYCSKCAGYHCFCQDHIFSHEHFTE